MDKAARPLDEAFGTAHGELLPPQQLLFGRPPRSAGSPRARRRPPRLGTPFLPTWFCHSRQVRALPRAGAEQSRGEPVEGRLPAAPSELRCQAFSPTPPLERVRPSCVSSHA